MEKGISKRKISYNTTEFLKLQGTVRGPSCGTKLPGWREGTHWDKRTKSSDYSLLLAHLLLSNMGRVATPKSLHC